MIKQLQARCPIIRLLLKSVSQDTHPKINNFKRYTNELAVRDGILVFYGRLSIVVVPFKIILEIAIAVHYNFAHIDAGNLCCKVNLDPRKTKSKLERAE